MPTADENNPTPAPAPEFPTTGFFGRRVPVSGADIKPAAVVPDGTDMNKFTDLIVASKAANEAESKRNLEKFVADEYQIQCKIARAEIADAKEKAIKKDFHAGVAKRQEEAQARRQAATAALAAEKQAARQKQVLRELAAFTASIANVITLLDELPTLDIAQVRLLRLAVEELNVSLNKS